MESLRNFVRRFRLLKFSLLSSLSNQFPPQLAPAQIIIGSAPNRIQIVVHAFHTQLLNELLAEVAQFVDDIKPVACRVLITTAASQQAEVNHIVATKLPVAEVFVFENRGRDILPFLRLVQSGELATDLVTLKIHTKAERSLSTGQTLNGELALNLLDPDALPAVLSLAQTKNFAATTNDHRYGLDAIGRNGVTLISLARRSGIRQIPTDFKFPAGSMFWTTPGLLNALKQLPVIPEDFEDEPISHDGGLPHAIERLYGLIAASTGAGLLALEEIRVAE